jgi:hypothetical protein
MAGVLLGALTSGAVSDRLAINDEKTYPEAASSPADCSDIV